MKLRLSNTNQRRVILEELRSVTSHPTADELYSMIREKLPKISLGTVYRNLELLSSAGQIMKLELSGKQKRFDGRPDQHFHMRCTACDCVVDLDDGNFKEIDELIRKKASELDLDGYNLELNGLCDKCREDNGSKDA
tara:strand:+ start:193 stop:603 length:411 start_codon:yes stop_codon:yes gene_type:complete